MVKTARKGADYSKQKIGKVYWKRRGRTFKNIRQRWKKYSKKSVRQYRRYSQSTMSLRQFKHMLILAQDTQFQDYDPDMVLMQVPAAPNANLAMAHYVIVQKQHFQNIVRGSGDAQRIGNMIHFRGFKLRMSIKPDYSTQVGLMYQKFRCIIWAFQVNNEANPISVEGDNDAFPQDYHDTYYKKEQPYKKNKNVIRKVWQQFIEFRPQFAIETEAITAQKDIEFGKDNQYDIDTFVQFPFKVTYTPATLINDGKMNEGWVFALHVYTDIKNNPYYGATPPLSSVLQVDYQTRLYWKDN